MERTNRGQRVNSPIKYYATFKGPADQNDVGIEIRDASGESDPQFYTPSEFNRLGFALISVGSSLAGFDQKNGIFYQSEIAQQGTLNKRPLRLFQTGQGVALTGTKKELEAQFPCIKFQIDLICYRFESADWKDQETELKLTKVTLRPAASLAWSNFLKKFKTNNDVFDNWIQFDKPEYVPKGKKDGRVTLAHHKPTFKLGNPIQEKFESRLNDLNSIWSDYGHSVKFYESDWPVEEVNYVKTEKVARPERDQPLTSEDTRMYDKPEDLEPKPQASKQELLSQEIDNIIEAEPPF